MPITGYSMRFSGEYDPEQLLSHYYGDRDFSLQSASQVTAEIEQFVRADVVCPACGNAGAQVIVPKKKTAHFRFSGSPGHKPTCELSADSDERSEYRVQLTQGSSKSDIMLVRELVCRGIEHGFFDQKTIHDMRMWFSDEREKSYGPLEVTEDDYNWMFCCLHQSEVFSGYKFYPEMAKMSGFSWGIAARMQANYDNIPLVEWVKSKNIILTRSLSDECLKILRKNRDRDVFNPISLQPYYEKTYRLCLFLRSNKAIHEHVLGAGVHYDMPGPTTKISDNFLAFCALILFCAGWDMSKALIILSNIVSSASARHKNLGNVVGLNPFHQYGAWKVLNTAQELSRRTVEHFGVTHAEVYEKTLERIKREHREWEDQQQEGMPS